MMFCDPKLSMAKTFFTLVFDSQLEQSVCRLWYLLAEQGICLTPDSRHRPHVTLVGFDVEEPESALGPLRSFCRRYRPIPIRLHHIGIFPERSVLFLQPRMTEALMSLHRAAVQELSSAFAAAPTSPNLAIDAWTPHCTLADGVSGESLGRAVRLVQEQWSKMEGTAIGIGVLVPPDIADKFQCLLGT